MKSHLQKNRVGDQTCSRVCVVQVVRVLGVVRVDDRWCPLVGSATRETSWRWGRDRRGRHWDLTVGKEIAIRFFSIINAFYKPSSKN